MVAHKWASWLHYPCRLGGSPPLQSGGQNQRWPTSGQGGYITHTAWGVPMGSERGAESEVAHKWARWLHNCCRLGGSPRLHSGGQNHRWATSGQGGYITHTAWGDPTASQRGAKSQVAHKWARWLHNPCRMGVPTASERGATSELAHKWAGGYITPTAWGVSTASKRGAESKVAHKWARWLHNAYRLGGPQRFRAGGKIRGGPQVGKVAA